MQAMCISVSTNAPCVFLEQCSISCLSVLSYSSVFNYVLPVFKTFKLLFRCLFAILGDTERLCIQVEGMLRGHLEELYKKYPFPIKDNRKKSHIHIVSLHITADKIKAKRCLNYKNHNLIRERGPLKKIQGENWLTEKWVLRSQC